MAKFPKPYFRTQRKSWAVQLGDRQVSLGPDKKLAFAEYHRLMAAEGRTVPQARLLTHVLLDLFLDHVERNQKPATYAWYRNYCQSFSDRHGLLRTDQILPLHVTGWLDAHPRWGVSTRRGAITAIKRCWAWAKAEGRISQNPLVEIRRPKQTRRKVMTAAGAEVLLAAIEPGPLLDFCQAMVETGCRPGELTGVEARMIDLDEARMTVTGKTGERSVSLSRRAVEILARLLVEFPTGPVFRNTRGQPWNRNSLRCGFRRLRKKTGVAGAVPYALRHLFGSRAIERGVDSLLVAELMGHSDVQMLKEHYVSYKAETLRLAVERATGAGDDAKPE